MANPILHRIQEQLAEVRGPKHKNSASDERGPLVLSNRKAVLYARVSSKEQEQEGFSIPAQLRLLKDYAQKHGFEIVQEFVDVETAKQAGREHFGEMAGFLKETPSRPARGPGRKACGGRQSRPD